MHRTTSNTVGQYMFIPQNNYTHFLTFTKFARAETDCLTDWLHVPSYDANIFMSAYVCTNSGRENSVNKSLWADGGFHCILLALYSQADPHFIIRCVDGFWYMGKRYLWWWLSLEDVFARQWTLILYIYMANY